ncbi:MAG: histone-lysine N-methyltransferase [Deltaproteobacteria bacterium]|jgi:isopropylmalate/homocitrate/citramalate synthase|nr:histone-lysine N-methyltransferase [Deltaproteobacteria bacterium]
MRKETRTPNQKLLNLRPSPGQYKLVEKGKPELFRDLFPYVDIPRLNFDGHNPALAPAADPVITDTTFRDGQQARPPYSVEQIVTLFKFLARLSGPSGVIRKSEFFLFNQKDRQAVEACRDLGLPFPLITSWIRAVSEDLLIVKEMGLTETGILTSISDYHIYLKLGLNRRRAADKYLALVSEALSYGIAPRCHFEDVTRADVYGMCIPLAQKLKHLSEQAKIPIVIRLCDTLGLGVTYPGAALPRSIPRLVRAFIEEAGFDGQDLEWHGHNDFHKGFVNATTAWLYGLGAINGSLLGFGERTGNTPIEGLLIEHAALWGSTPGVDYAAITELAKYFETELNVRIPPNYPLVGRDFNSTSAGIHADGLLKNEEIYNIFDTRKILNRPPSISINDKSGSAGLVHWLNQRLSLTGGEELDKRNPAVVKMNRAIQKEYENGRITNMSARELERLARHFLPQKFESQFDHLRYKARELVQDLILTFIQDPIIRSMVPSDQEKLMEKWVTTIPYIQFMYVTDKAGIKITRNVTSVKEKKRYSGQQDVGSNLSDRVWFVKPMEDGQIHVTDFYTSRFTQALCITVSGPIRNDQNEIVGVLGLDIRFDYLANIEAEELESPEVDEL